MRLTRQILSILKNKYVLAFLFFAVWIGFFDKNDLITQYKRSNELKDLNQSKVHFDGLITTTREELRQLDSDPALLEKYAREKYLMKKDNEDIFIFADPATGQKK